MSIDNFCQRPKTTRRYLHPTLSERFAVLWAEGKLIFGNYNIDIPRSRACAERIYQQQISCGIWPVWGAALNRFDFKQAANSITEDGTPIHGVTFRQDSFLFSMECFCNTARKSTLFCKVTVKNTGANPISEQIGFLLRTTMERDLVYGFSDAYISHDPSVKQWLNITNSWYKMGDLYTDGTHQLTFSIPTKWNLKNGIVTLALALAAGEELTFTFKLDKGEVSGYDYAQEKVNTTVFWNKELARINKLPVAATNDPATAKTVRHMVAQLLQMIVYTTEGLVIPRQGGLQRAIWPTEALSVIEGLCRIGDFGDYLEPIFSTYFSHMQEPSGEVGAMGIYWASITAAVLYSFSQYCNTSENKEFFAKYRDQAYAGFRFIKELRRSVSDTDQLAGGLFPPLRGIDWSQQFQCWTSTDVFNLLGLDALADTFKAYGDPAADEMRQEHTAYLTDMKRHFQKYYEAQSGSDTLRIPLKPIGDDTDLVEDFYPCLYQGRFVHCGVIDNEVDMLRVYRQLLKDGITKEGLGLYGHMPYKDGNDNVWYLSFPDLYWFEIWMQYGYRNKAKEILDAQLRYGMTEEYYFCERIDTADPYYVPWSPNASATGRTLIMISKLYQ